MQSRGKGRGRELWFAKKPLATVPAIATQPTTEGEYGCAERLDFRPGWLVRSFVLDWTGPDISYWPVYSRERLSR